MRAPRARVAAVLAGLYAAYAAASWLAVPWAVRRALREVGASLPGFSASAAEARWDPFRLALRVRGFALAHEKLGDLATCDELYASVQPLYLLRFAVGLRELRLTKPRLVAVIAADGGTALSYLPKGEPAAAEAPAKAPFIPRVIIRRFAIERGALELDSRLPSAPQRLMAYPIDFSLENFSTLPDAQGAYTFAARTNRDERLSWQGRLSVRPLRLTGRASLLGLDLTRQDTAVPASPVSLSGGRLDAETDYALAYDEGVLTAGLSRARLAVSGVLWKPRGSGAEPRGPFALAVDPASLELRAPLPAPPGARTTLEVEALIAGSGRARLDAAVTAAPLSGLARLRLSGLPLAPFSPLAPPPTRVSIDSGAFSLEGRVRLSTGPASVAADGSLSLEGLSVSDAVSRRPLARLRRLAVEGLRADPGARVASVDRVRLEAPYLRLFRAASGRTNVEEALGVSFSSASAPAAAARPAPEPAPAWRARLKRFTLAGGSVVVQDDAVAPPFSLSLKEASAELSDLSTDGRSTATLSSKALLENAPVSLTGTVRLSSAAAWVSARVKAAAVQLPAFTPYSIQVIGYKLDKGTLDLDLSEDLAVRDIRSRNKVVVDQLTLGEKVDSPTAINAPVKLGLAILKDRRGVIDLDVPIDGSLDDPEFRLMPVILKTLLNVVIKAATSPFDALSKAFGGGADLSKVAFAAGGDAPGEAALSALDKVAQALADRPGLFLGVRGAAGGDDALALGDLALRRRLRGSEPGPSELTAAEEKKVLSLHASELGAPAADAAAARAALARRLAPAGAELRALALARAAAVHEALKARGVDAARLFSLEPAADAAAAGPAPCELQLEAR